MYREITAERQHLKLMATPKEDITQHEIQALKTRFNLADAHTHQSQSPSQRRIVASLPALWYEAESQSQYQAEQDFIETFYGFHGQHTALKRREQIYLVYAASIAMHITATYLRKNNLRVGLIEPCFDNLHDLLKHMQVPLTPLDESLFQEHGNIYGRLTEVARDVDALLLVDPNNPTGFSLFAHGTEAFTELVRYCRDHDKLLILDLCFAAFMLAAGRPRPDVYEILEAADVRYIAMEDTGKTWPLQDAKCATLMASRAIDRDIYNIVTSVLLNVSPFILKLVTRYIEDSGADGFASVRELLEHNRQLAVASLESTLLSYCPPLIPTSVAWFHIDDPAIDADQLQSRLQAHQVYVLPGKYFYWNTPQRGQRFIRVALARRPEEFTPAMACMRQVLEADHG
jgi:aspartate/methionine/tyrosine aminotransferase